MAFYATALNLPFFVFKGMARVRMLVACAIVLARGSAAPNFVFILSESLDGRLLRPDSAANIPNIRALMSRNSVRFDTGKGKTCSLSRGIAEHDCHAYRRLPSAYSNNPVCSPSRSSLWSGRAPHKIVHEHNGMVVNGVWNNYEGLPVNYSMRLDQILQTAGYDTLVVGKTDYTVGGHTESCFVESFTFNVP